MDHIKNLDGMNLLLEGCSSKGALMPENFYIAKIR